MKLSPLIGRMVERMPPHQVRVRAPNGDFVDEIGTLAVVSATEAQLVLPDAEGRVTIERATRTFANANPQALWVADIRDGDDTATLTPFAPPRIENLGVGVPVRVDESLRKRLGELRLPRDGDLLPTLALRAARGHVAVLGMRTIAALDTTDARRVTWWLPDGGALELLVEDDGQGGTVLQLVDVVRESDAHTANAGPNVVVHLQPGAALPMVGPSEGKGPRREAVAVLHPPRSKLMDAWARYTMVARQEGEDRQAARGRYPIAYTDAVQRGPHWRARATLAPDAIEAWVGAGQQEGRDIRVDQAAAVVEGERDAAKVTVETIVVRGPGQLDLLLKAERGVSVIPVSGVLAARENMGERVRIGREREALEMLTKGAAACPSLPLLLAKPEAATPPTMGPLRPVPEAALDESQERAVQAIVGCEDLLAIQGPPGTGKTGVFAEALRQIAAKGRRDGRTYRVLVSSGQNEAITNLLQRLAAVDGVFVHVVERAARDEDEGFRFAARLEDQRGQALQKLEARLAESAIAARLARVREAADAISELRALAAAGPRGWGRLATRLREVADDADAPLGHFDRDEARALARSLDAERPDCRDGERPPDPGNVNLAARALPADPAAVAGWWDAAGADWPAEHRAAVGAAAAEVAGAAATENPIRRDLALKRALPRLRTAIAATQWPAPAAPPAPLGIPLEDRLDAWVATADRRVREAGDAITASPEGVAWRFVQSLREDPGAWACIVERHGNTVAATCSMAAKAMPDPGAPYDWVIVDEAGHATPFELLVPMVQGRRVVLIGDHRQLPPMVDEAIARRAADEGGWPLDIDGLTLFGELFRLLPRTNALRLGVQYRMHEDIGRMVDSVFYRGHGEGLVTHFAGDRVSPKWLVEVDTPEGRRAVPRSRGMFSDAPVVLHDVPTRARCTEDNPDEAGAVVDLVQRYQLAGVDHRDIAIICPYRRQRARIEAALREAQLAAQVRTIDSVQGREYPVVLLCLVRTDGSPGFLSSPNRLNVAISRAQRQIVFVGSASTFLSSKRVRGKAPHLHQVLTEAVRLDEARRELL